LETLQGQDITKFFDHVNHDILMGRIGTAIRDKRVLGLIGKYLRRGAMAEGVAITSEEGTPDHRRSRNGQPCPG
jgi:retron-type reverse transcriptase